MIGYGALALEVTPLKNLNNAIQHSIVTNNPNFSTYADNVLWLAPTVAQYRLNVVGVQGKTLSGTHGYCRYFQCFDGIVIAGPAVSIVPNYSKLAQYGLTPAGLQFQVQT